MKANKALWIVCALALLVKLLMLCGYAHPEGDDGLRYLRTGMNLVDSGVLSSDGYGNLGYQPDPKPTAHDLPLYPGLLGGMYACTKSAAATQRAAVALNIALAFVALFFLLKTVRGEPFGFSAAQQTVAAAVFLFMPESVQYSMCTMPDMTAVMFCTVAVWAYFRSVYARAGWILVSALAFSAASYAKPICIPLSLALLASRLFYSRVRPNGRALLRLCALVLAALAVYAGLFAPWYLRNARVYGKGGISTIAGTNLFHDNLARYVATLPDPAQRDALRARMRQVEEEVRGKDLMTQAGEKAAFAKRAICENLGGYVCWTLRAHPRLYAGCGLAALFRFMGYERGAFVLQGEAAFRAAHKPIPAVTACDRVLAWGAQGLAWCVLLAAYALVALGVWRGFGRYVRGTREGNARLGYWLAILSLVLLAAVIGPIATTRYRFIMIPFFAILAGMAWTRGRRE